MDYVSQDYDHSNQGQMLRCLATKVEAPGVMTFTFEASKARETEVGNHLADPGQFASFDFQVHADLCTAAYPSAMQICVALML